MRYPGRYTVEVDYRRSKNDPFALGVTTFFTSTVEVLADALDGHNDATLTAICMVEGRGMVAIGHRITRLVC